VAADRCAHRVPPPCAQRRVQEAGNLKSAMSCSYVNDYEFVAIFDATFQGKFSSVSNVLD
jgi:hypothetical protein